MEPPPPYSVCATVEPPPPYSVNATTNDAVAPRGHIGHETHRVTLALPTRSLEQIAPNSNTVQVESPNVTILQVGTLNFSLVQVESVPPQSEENIANSLNSSSQQSRESARQSVNSSPTQPTERANVNSSSLQPLESVRQILNSSSVPQGGNGRLQFADRLKRNREVAPASDTSAGSQQERLVVVALILALPVSMIAMGVVHLEDCPAEPMIPVYLIVAGIFAVASMILFALVVPCTDSESKIIEIIFIILTTVWALFCLFDIIWWLAGCVYIYRTKDDFVTDDKNSDKYCDPTLYWFAFWITTAVYIITAASCCCVCCVGGLTGCFLKEQ